MSNVLMMIGKLHLYYIVVLGATPPLLLSQNSPFPLRYIKEKNRKTFKNPINTGFLKNLNIIFDMFRYHI